MASRVTLARFPRWWWRSSLRQDVFEEELAGRRGMVDARLLRLEDSLKRVADAVQIMALEREGKGGGRQ